MNSSVWLNSSETDWMVDIEECDICLKHRYFGLSSLIFFNVFTDSQELLAIKDQVRVLTLVDNLKKGMMTYTVKYKLPAGVKQWFQYEIMELDVFILFWKHPHCINNMNLVEEIWKKTCRYEYHSRDKCLCYEYIYVSSCFSVLESIILTCISAVTATIHFGVMFTF